MSEYQQIVDRRFRQKVEARVRAMTLRAQADAKRAARREMVPASEVMNTFQTEYGPAYTVIRKSSFGIGTVSGYTMKITLPYLTILGGCE